MIATAANILTNSQVNTARTCLRKNWFSYEFGIRRDVDAQPLRFGSALHLGLDAWKQPRKPDQEPGYWTHIKAAVAEYDATRPADAGEDWTVEREQLARLLAGYFWRWEQAPMKWIASELEFRLPLVNPTTGRKSRSWLFAGKVDGIAELPDGRLAIVEHKTSGQGLEPESDYWKRLRIDSQISLYWQAAKALGYNVQTIIYDVIRKPTIRPKAVTKAAQKEIAETGLYCGEAAEVCDHETPSMYGARLNCDIGERPDYYYARQEIPRVEQDLADAMNDLWQTAKILSDCRSRGHWPRNTSACIGFGRCQYFDLCANGYDCKAGNVPDGFIRVDNTHPELEELGK
jgi:hypothetical protein